MADDLERRISELEDQLKQRDRRIEELRQEIDEQRDLIQRLRENAENYTNCMEAWRDAFGMELTDGGWTLKPFLNQYQKILDDYGALIRDWNKYLPLINGEPRPVGRPLAASEAQIDTVRKLHKDRMSLRDIMIETNLSFSTVRTIVGQLNRTDPTTKKHKARFERIEQDKAQAVRSKWQQRTINTLPKRAQALVEQGKALVTEAKGLGRGRK
jgi:uncharacterized coiled-coil protein SlyX